MGKNKAKLVQYEYPNGVIRCCAVDEETHEKLEDPVYRKKYFNVLPFDEDSSTNECLYSTEDIPEIDKELETDDISLPVEASDMQYSEETYTFENIIYNVNATKEVHQQLANDPVFYAEYFKDQQNAMEVVRIQDESTDNDKSAAIEIFKWDQSSTKWLLENYSERIHKFRDPKIKKKTLWAEIKSEFEKKGYEGINEDILDRKLRNMKKTYRTIKYNNGKSATGRGRISWEWFDQFEDMFKEDKTVNFGHLISSINETTETLQQPSLPGAQSLEEKLTEGQPSRESYFYPKPLLSTMQLNNGISSQHRLARLSVQCQNSTDSTVNSSCTSCILSYSDSFDSTDESSNSGPGTSHLSPSRISPAEFTSTRKRRANERSRSLYSLRHKHLEIEKTRIEEIRKLREAVDKSNDIQEQRNKILQQILHSCNK